MLLTIPRKDIIINTFVPDSVKIKYFDRMYDKKSLYVCVLIEEKSAPRIFLEKNTTEEVEGIVRVFFEKNDIDTYMAILTNDKKIQSSSIKYWEANYEELANLLIKIDKSNKQKMKKGIRGIACTVVDYTVVDLDIFWTNEKSLMV